MQKNLNTNIESKESKDSDRRIEQQKKYKIININKSMEQRKSKQSSKQSSKQTSSSQQSQKLDESPLKHNSPYFSNKDEGSHTIINKLIQNNKLNIQSVRQLDTFGSSDFPVQQSNNKDNFLTFQSDTKFQIQNKESIKNEKPYHDPYFDLKQQQLQHHSLYESLNNNSEVCITKHSSVQMDSEFLVNQGSVIQRESQQARILQKDSEQKDQNKHSIISQQTPQKINNNQINIQVYYQQQEQMFQSQLEILNNSNNLELTIKKDNTTKQQQQSTQTVNEPSYLREQRKYKVKKSEMKDKYNNMLIELDQFRSNSQISKGRSQKSQNNSIIQQFKTSIRASSKHISSNKSQKSIKKITTVCSKCLEREKSVQNQENTSKSPNRIKRNSSQFVLNINIKKKQQITFNQYKKQLQSLQNN